MGIIDLIQNLTGLSTNSEEDVDIDLFGDTMCLIQNPQWGSNLHWISEVNKEISGTFVSHLLDSRFYSVIKYLGTYLVMDSLVLLMVTYMGVSYSAKFYKHSDMSNVEDRAFSIMIPLQIQRKLDPVIFFCE